MDAVNQSRFEQHYNNFVAALKLHGKAPKTIESYSFSLTRLSSFFDRCPDDLSRNELFRYFSHLHETRSWSLIKIERSAIRCYYLLVLGMEMPWIENLKPPKQSRLPDILSRAEVARLIRETRAQRFRLLWLVLYSMGLRLGEALSLRVGDIDAEHMRVHIRDAKGGKDRYVILPALTLLELRRHWTTHRNPEFIFPARAAQDASTQLDHGTAQKAFAEVRATCGIQRKVSPHTLRHCYATHLIEAGLNVHSIQLQLGHTSPQTTSRYLHLTDTVRLDAQTHVDRIVAPLAAIFALAARGADA